MNQWLSRVSELLRQPGASAFIALAAGVIFPLALAPFNLWGIAFISLLVFLWTLDSCSARGITLRYYLFYLGMFAHGVSWIYVSIHVYGNASPPLAVLLVALFVVGWSLTAIPHGLLHAFCLRNHFAGIVLGFPALWVVSEVFRSWLFTGFPWLFLGYSQLSSPLAGFAPLGSVYLVSLAVAATAASLFLAFRDRRVQMLFPVVLVWILGAGLDRYSWVDPSGEIDVAAVQGNVDQHSKWRREMVGPIIERYESLTEPAWDADLVVWPEAAITLFRSQASGLLNDLEQRALANNATLVLGIPDRNQEGGFLNTAIAVGQGQGSYHKRRLVPFGEYVPLENYLRGVIDFFDLPMSRNHAGPDEQAPLTAGELSLSLSICYEIVYPHLVRSAAPSPDLLVTISNDTWFGRSIGPDQHLQMALMRALENGRPLVRATNNGITVLADHKGQVIDSLAMDEPGTLRGTVTLVQGETPYRQFGQLPVAVICLMIVGILGIRQAFR